MLNHILVPLDGSPLSEKALAYVRDIVNPSGKITLLQVVKTPEAQPPTADAPAFMAVVGSLVDPWSPTPHEKRLANGIRSSLMSQGESYLHQMAARLAAPNLHVELSIQADVDPAEAIVQAARGLNVDAVVMATHGRSGYKRWLLGSVTHQVLDELPCAVFVIPPENQH
jgi:nucleotide-binding universal stress UspA family protein